MSTWDVGAEVRTIGQRFDADTPRVAKCWTIFGVACLLELAEAVSVACAWPLCGCDTPTDARSVATHRPGRPQRRHTPARAARGVATHRPGPPAASPHTVPGVRARRARTGVSYPRTTGWVGSLRSNCSPGCRSSVGRMRAFSRLDATLP